MTGIGNRIGRLPAKSGLGDSECDRRKAIIHGFW